MLNKEDEQYENRVQYLIRIKYTINDEFKILRERDTFPEQFQEYYNYVEECKEKAKENL